MPFVTGAQQVRGARRARRAGARARRAEDAGGVADQDRQRRALARLGPALAASARSRIPENEPGSSIMPGKVNPTQCEALTMLCGAGDRQRRRRQHRRRVGQLRAQRLQAAHHPQLPAERAPARPTARASFDEHCARGIEPNRERIARARAALADAGDRAQPAHRLRQGGEDREEGAQAGQHAARGGARARAASRAEQFDAWVVPEQMVGGDAAQRAA